MNRHNTYQMRNRRITVLLLAWLFSHQLFAAVLSISTTNSSCHTDNQSQCEIEASEYIGHFMPMMSNTDSKADDENNLSIISDYCSLIYQSLLPNINSVTPLTTHSTFDIQSISTAVKTRPKVSFALCCLFNTE